MERVLGREVGAAADLDPRDQLRLLRETFGELRFVHLVRGDVLGQAVSWARAEQSGYWQQDDHATAEPRYDRELITKLINDVTEHQAAWRSWFAATGVTPTG